MDQKTVTEIAISTEFLELQQLLKIIGFISTGGEVKIFLANEVVKVNGTDENRRGKKLYPGYLVEVRGKGYKIVEKCS
ncbi:MAG: S4 domain-containing protein YaaA [Erysipelotrichaceae bacterium]|jgi:S4 domain protein YaaA|nr:S4 domain-containing protein YaaA [Erysipelotrichaceae bacterium]